MASPSLPAMLCWKRQSRITPLLTGSVPAANVAVQLVKDEPHIRLDIADQLEEKGHKVCWLQFAD
jgi:hypothetical protein